MNETVWVTCLTCLLVLLGLAAGAGLFDREP